VSDLDPAPGDLRIVQRLVNTADHEHGTDELATPEALATWLTRHGLLAKGTKLTQTDLDWARDAREALRDALAANNGGDPAKAAARLDRIAARSPVVVRFSADCKSRLEPGSDDVDGALGRIFAIVALAQVDGSWARLRACAAAECRAAFYDPSKSRTGKWCSMRRCGNRRNSRRSHRIRDQVREERRARR
jgi:predicted RNA-binding Zn ribbon-like protein